MCFGVTGQFSEINGWTLFKSSQWAVHETGLGNITFFRKTRSKSISSFPTTQCPLSSSR